MRSRLGQVDERTSLRTTPEAMMSAAVAPTVKEIPYDYVATFTLEGRCGKRVQDVINISIEGAFVAVAVGYSFVLAQLPQRAAAGAIPALAAPPGQDADWLFANVIQPNVEAQLLGRCLLARMCGIQFKYSIIDSGTGRELQNKPIHNIAGLGESTGDRPFRRLAKPMLFMPRSSIRIEIEEISQGPIFEGAELYIVLHGYKMLGYGTGLP